jgi:hypothetical protein
MSVQGVLEDQRATLFAALQSVGEVTAHATTPDTPTAYDAWPALGDGRPFTTCMIESDWNVFVALPGGDQSSIVAAGEALYAPVCDALMEVCKVAHSRPMRYPLAEGGEIPVWQFEITI